MKLASVFHFRVNSLSFFVHFFKKKKLNCNSRLSHSLCQIGVVSSLSGDSVTPERRPMVLSQHKVELRTLETLNCLFGWPVNLFCTLNDKVNIWYTTGSNLLIRLPLNEERDVNQISAFVKSDVDENICNWLGILLSRFQNYKNLLESFHCTINLS